MTQPDTTELRTLAEQATPGPWRSGGVWWEHWDDPEGRKCHTPWPTVSHGSTGADIAAKATNEADAAFIAAANPTTILALLDRLDAAETKVAAVEGLLSRWESGADEWGTCGHEWVSLRDLRAALGETANQPTTGIGPDGKCDTCRNWYPRVNSKCPGCGQ